jgi:hypothetical protein
MIPGVPSLHGGFLFADQVVTRAGMRGVVVKLLGSQLERSCSGCPRREGFRADPERYGLCTGCSPHGDEGRGKGSGQSGPILVAFPYLRAELMYANAADPHWDCILTGRFYADELTRYEGAR